MSFNSLSSTRRELLAGAAAAGVATMLAGSSNAAKSNVGSPFSVSYPQDQLDDLRRRVAATRWPDKETVADDTQGVQLETVRKLARLLGDRLRLAQGARRRLNALPQFITEIDGLDIHFIHVRSKHENALPIIVTHGWPGSIIEQLKIIEPLTDPDRAWRQRSGRLRRRDPVAAGLRLLRQADRAGLDTRPASPRRGRR